MIGRPGAYHPALSAALYDAIRDRTSPDGLPAPSTQPVERGNGETHQEEQARALPDAIFQRAGCVNALRVNTDFRTANGDERRRGAGEVRRAVARRLRLFCRRRDCGDEVIARAAPRRFTRSGPVVCGGLGWLGSW